MQAARRHVNSLFGFISSIVPPIATVYNMLRCPADQREQDGRKDNVSICAWNEGHNRFRRRDCRESPCFPPYSRPVRKRRDKILLARGCDHGTDQAGGVTAYYSKNLVISIILWLCFTWKGQRRSQWPQLIQAEAFLSNVL